MSDIVELIRARLGEIERAGCPSERIDAMRADLAHLELLDMADDPARTPVTAQIQRQVNAACRARIAKKLGVEVP